MLARAHTRAGPAARRAHFTSAPAPAPADANARLFCMPLFDDLGMQRQANEYRTRIQQQRGGSMTDDDELTSGLGGPENKPHFVGEARPCPAPLLCVEANPGRRASRRS